MNEFRTEDLESLLQFFDLMLNVFFDSGIFRKTVTDVNIHERLGLANEVRATKCFLSRLYTRSKKGKRRNRMGRKQDPYPRFVLAPRDRVCRLSMRSL